MLSRTKKQAVRTLKVYASYNFIDKDPIIDYTRAKVYENGGPSKVSRASGVTASTLYGWYSGTTRHPQFATVARVMLACGETTLDLKKLKAK
jgi:DNA-binding phage protein